MSKPATFLVRAEPLPTLAGEVPAHDLHLTCWVHDETFCVRYGDEAEGFAALRQHFQEFHSEVPETPKEGSNHEG